MQNASNRRPFNRSLKRLIISLFVIIALFVLLIVTIGLPEEAVEPYILGEEAIKNTFASDSFRYKCRSTLYIEEEERIFSVLNGEKAGDGRHVEGSILGSPVNIYHLGETAYQQDSLNGAWHTIENIELGSAKMLLSEIDPAKDFSYSEVLSAEYLGKIDVEGEKAKHLVLKVVLTDKWIERYFTDITYDLAVRDKGEPCLLWAVVSAVSKENPAATLVIENYFYDYGEEITLSPPVIQ